MLQPFTRRAIRSQVEALLPEKVTVHIPIEVDCPVCGRIAFDDAALSIDCPSCNGEGVIRRYKVSNAKARILWTDPAKATFGIVSGAELGDVRLQVKKSAEGLFEEARTTKNAYVKVDGRTCAVRSVVPIRVEGITSTEVRLSLQRDKPTTGA